MTPPDPTPPTVRLDRTGGRGAGSRWFPSASAATVVLGLLLGGAAAVVLFADVLGVDHRTPLVQLIAFRWQLAAALVVVAALGWLLARALWPLALALAVVGVAGLLAVSPRMVAASPPPPGDDDLTVLVVNAYLGRADPEDLAGLIADRRPDVVVLPEARGDLREDLDGELDGAGARAYRSWAADRSGDGSPMAVLVAEELGRPEVRADRETVFPSLVVDLPDGPRVVAVHTQSPKPGDTREWQRDIAALARWCDTDRPTVVAGDLNATLDHGELRDAIRGCTDAAADVGRGLAGTWPAQVPSMMGVQIDHVLTANGPRARSVEFPEVAGTDHRGVLARLAQG